MKQKVETYRYSIDDRSYNVKSISPSRTESMETKAEEQNLSKLLYDIFVKYEKNRK